ncbi:MAG TPA: DNA translocase FtsK 4TM domain-containing protein, partial [Terriglobales bacterium]|nr:DNA translocase FtsK 4TM domain-containing protein [Terriglobales bacterium]
PALLGARWFRSRKVQSPVAKSLGGMWLLIFVPAFLALLPGHVRWLGVIPMEGLVGRIVGDFLIHYLNLAGAYIVCATVLAVALYLSTAFSFSNLQVWIPTRFAFAIALRDRWHDWRSERLQAQVREDCAHDADPVACSTDGRQHRSTIERRIERGIGREREEKEERGDDQQEADQLIEPPVAGWIEYARKSLHLGVFRTLSCVQTQQPPVTEARQSLSIMPRTRPLDNHRIEPAVSK